MEESKTISARLSGDMYSRFMGIIKEAKMTSSEYIIYSIFNEMPSPSDGQMEDEVRELTKKLLKLRRFNDYQEKEIKELSEKLTEYNESLSKAKSQITELEDKIVSLNGQLIDASFRENEQELEIKNLRKREGRITELREELIQAQKRIITSELDLKNAKERLTTAKKDNKAKIAVLQANHNMFVDNIQASVVKKDGKYIFTDEIEFITRNRWEQ